jgi:hypothetical protein
VLYAPAVLTQIADVDVLSPFSWDTVPPFIRTVTSSPVVSLYLTYKSDGKPGIVSYVSVQQFALTAGSVVSGVVSGVVSVGVGVGVVTSALTTNSQFGVALGVGEILGVGVGVDVGPNVVAVGVGVFVGAGVIVAVGNGVDPGIPEIAKHCLTSSALHAPKASA